MISKKILCDCVKLRIFANDASDYSAEYDEYSLSDVRVVEKCGSDPDMTPAGSVSVYFFDGQSSCTDSEGAPAALPRLKHGDLCVLRPGTLDEREMRVYLAEYHSGISSGSACLSHVKIVLK